MAGFNQDLLQDAAGSFGSVYLRDYAHASKTFRTNSYQNAPKLKFLFHTYFDINPAAYTGTANFGVLVKEIKLPAYSFTVVQLNQYNRKRIIQNKIKYEAIDITFHDDTGNQVNRLWEAYYKFYYNDGTKPGSVLSGNRGGRRSVGPLAAGYNERNIYQDSITGNDDWGFIGGASDTTGKKVPFFKNITIFGFDQHNFTAYTLINPIITNFSHDKYSYSEGNGTMQNTMTIDYETVVYNYGAMDGRDPGNIVTGFGDPSTYDRTISPITKPGSQGTILGQGGLLDAAGGTLSYLGEGDILNAVQTAGVAYNTFKNTNLVATAGVELASMLTDAIRNAPITRNTQFFFPTAQSTPGPLGLASSPPIEASSSPKDISNIPNAGAQVIGNKTKPTTSPSPIFGPSMN